MKITVKKPVEVEVSEVRCVLPVRCEEEDIPNNYPRRTGDVWDITIDASTGQILGWPDGVDPRDLYMKVCDEGKYYLMGGDGSVIWKRIENYVPAFVPGKYGDYITFNIDAVGVIKNWGNYFTNDNVAAVIENSDE